MRALGAREMPLGERVGPKPTRGEALFEVYLQRAGLKYGRPSAILPAIPEGARHPDYLVYTHSGTLACEVKEFGRSEARRRIEDRFRRGARVTALGSLSGTFRRKVEEMMRDASDQYEGGIGLGLYPATTPFVLVLYNFAGVIPLDPRRVQRVLKSLWNKSRFTEIAAVAVLHRHFPASEALGKKILDRYGTASTWERLEFVVERYLEALDEVPEAELSAEAVELALIRHPCPQMALQLDSFPPACGRQS